MYNTYPFFNLELGECFMYGMAPYMKIGKQNVKGNYCTMEVNAVSLTQGNCVHFQEGTIVTLIENEYKNFKYEEKEEGENNDKNYPYSEGI